MDITRDDDAKAQLLKKAKRIAVVGASANPDKTSHRIFGYLKERGYDVLPVTPKPDPVHGIDPVPDLAAAAEHWREDGGIDIVDVFRRREHTPGVAKEAAGAGAKALWLQLELDHPDAVATALEAGMDVVADKCIFVEHRRLVNAAD